MTGKNGINVEQTNYKQRTSRSARKKSYAESRARAERKKRKSTKRC